jgi:hypothetical protein
MLKAPISYWYCERFDLDRLIAGSLDRLIVRRSGTHPFRRRASCLPNVSLILVCYTIRFAENVRRANERCDSGTPGHYPSVAG